ncbi:hypothetical protein BH10ACT1_BH10ACT1_03580 [soil metagenome]
MPDRTTYEIVIRGRPSARLLRPLLDDFTFHHHQSTTRLVGQVTDTAHLHGLLAHLASVNAEVISIAPLTDQPPQRPRSTNP